MFNLILEELTQPPLHNFCLKLKMNLKVNIGRDNLIYKIVREVNIKVNKWHKKTTIEIFFQYFLYKNYEIILYKNILLILLRKLIK